MDEIKYPLTFDKCPNCGSTRRIGNEVLQQEKDKGRAGHDMNAYLFTHNSLIADQRKAMLSWPVISSFYDVCVDCGTVYCIQVNVQQVTPQMKQPPSIMQGKN